MKLHELQEARASAVTNMRALADLAETEKRDLTVDEDKKFGDLKKEIADLDKKIGRAQTLADAERSAPAVVHGRLGDGAFEERARDFSVVKCIRSTLPANMGGTVDIGFEREIGAEVARRTGRNYEGFAVPDEIFQAERRTLLAGSGAADLIPNTHRADLFIDRLRNRLVVGRLGATYLDGLVGTVDIPRQTGSSSAQWVAEDGSLTEDDASFDDVTFSPNTVGAMTSYSRRTIINASPAIENIVRADLAAVVASAIDEKALVGDGTSNTPKGITQTTGVTELAVTTTPTWAQVLEFIASIDASNALEGSLGWATNPHVVALMRAAVKVTSDAGAGFIMDAANALAGYPLVNTMALPGVAPAVTPQVDAALIFGDWSQLMVGSWTGIDILANPYETTAYAKGRILVRAMKDVDVQVRQPKAFAFTDTLATGTSA
jgi:HK97 family phage major capsid protein